MTNLKQNLIAIAVLSTMPTPYRRAGFVLEKGDNSSLEVNQEQFEALDADKNLTVSILDAELAQSDVSTHVKSERILAANVEQLRDENASLQSKVAELTKLGTSQQDTIKQLEEELAASEAATILGLGADTTTINDLDVSSAPHELHHWIVVIDEINKESPLTKKPNCDHLTVTANGEEITPTAAERDAAWAWYQENVVIASSDAVESDTEA